MLHAEYHQAYSLNHAHLPAFGTIDPAIRTNESPQSRTLDVANKKWDVMQNNEPDLFLHEEILLLALKDKTGTIDWKAGHFGFALGGAMLTELLLAGCIEVEEGKKPFVNVVDDAPLGDPLLDESLDKIATAKRRKQLSHWLPVLAHTPKLMHRVAAELCRKDVLKEDEGKVLFFFKRKIYPELNPEPERRLIERLREAIFTDTAEVDSRTMLLISLANAVGLLNIPFDAKELKKRKDRIEHIVTNEQFGEAAMQAIRAAQAAAMAISLMMSTNTMMMANINR